MGRHTLILVPLPLRELGGEVRGVARTSPGLSATLPYEGRAKATSVALGTILAPLPFRGGAGGEGGRHPRTSPLALLAAGRG